MLKEQLFEIKKSAKTITNDLKTRVRFIEDDSVDINMLIDVLEFPCKYTTIKSLQFDRHSLSEKEEKKFNKKFSMFLKGLILHMNNPQIDILLEFLVRVYCIDTFNPTELRFLLLPFPKYFKQLLCMHFRDNCEIKQLKSYSNYTIASSILKDDYLMVDFIEYCRNYNTLKEFVNNILHEIVEIARNSIESYVNDFYEIFNALIECNNGDKAHEVYCLMGRLHNYTEIADLFSTYSLPVDNKAVNLSRNEKIYRDNDGRRLLKEVYYLCKYLEYLDTNQLVPCEFTVNEFNILRNIFLKTRYKITSYQDIVNLYNEIDPKFEVDKYLIDNQVCFMLQKETRVLYRDSFDITVFTDQNYVDLIYNLPKSISDDRTQEILHKCLTFKTFKPEVIIKSLFKNNVPNHIIQKIITVEYLESDEVVKLNVLNFIKAIRYDITTQLLATDFFQDRIYLSYLLSSEAFLTQSQILKLIHAAQIINTPSIFIYLIGFICNKKNALPNSFKVNEFCDWAITNGYMVYLETFIADFSLDIATNNHLRYLGYTFSLASLIELKKRNVEFLPVLYDSEKFEIILEIGKHYGLEYVLIKHPKVIDMLEKCHLQLNEKDIICRFLLDNIENRKAVSILLAYYDRLVDYRLHPSWYVIKIILIDGIQNKRHAQKICDSVLDNLIDFDETDADLFEAICCDTSFIDLNRLKSIPHSNGAATLLDIYLKNTYADVLAILPTIAPVLIAFKKESVETLFEKYKNIMGSYAKQVIEQYPEKSYLLISLEPRITIKELCGNFSQSVKQTFAKILEIKKCNSEDILKRLVMCFNTHLGTLLLEKDLILLIEFYFRSFNGELDNFMSTFLCSVFKASPSIFFATARSTLNFSSSIYVDVAETVCKDLATENITDLENILFFLCTFLKYEVHAFTEASALYDVIYNIKSEYTPLICSLLLRDDSKLLSSKIKMLIIHIEEKVETEKALDVLICIFKDNDQSSKYKCKLLPYVVVLLEESSQNISNKASILLEIIQN